MEVLLGAEHQASKVLRIKEEEAVALVPWELQSGRRKLSIV